MNLHIFESPEMSISIMAKNEAAAREILLKNVKDPSKFTKGSEIDFNETDFEDYGDE